MPTLHGLWPVAGKFDIGILWLVDTNNVYYNFRCVWNVILHYFQCKEGRYYFLNYVFDQFNYVELM